MIKSLFLFAAFLLISCAASKRTASTRFAKNPVIAHRGAFKKNNFPENSIAALQEAIRLKCTGSEFDVRMSLDDSLVINHDAHYNKLDIERTTYEDLTRVKLFNGEVLPTLRQYLVAGLVNNRLTRLVIEIKPSEISKERGRLIAEKVVRLVHDLRAEKQVAYISFDYDILKKIVSLDPKASTQYLNGDQPPDQLRADRIDGADYHISVFRKHPEWIESAQKNGIILNAWTVNTEEDMRWLLEKKFHLITTNEPERLLDMVKFQR